MLVSKVHQKAVALSHQHARLEATYRVLFDLLDDGSSIEAPTADVELIAEEKDVHIKVGVQWSTFAMQMMVAIAVGAVVESSRLRTQRPRKGGDLGGVADAIASTSFLRPKSAVFGSF